MSDEIVIAPPHPASLTRRIIAYPLTLMLLAILIFIAASIVAGMLNALWTAPANSPLLLVKAAIQVLCVLAALWPFFHYVERDPTGLFERRGWAKELLAGLVGGAAIFAFIVAVVAALGGYHVAGGSGLDTIWQVLAGATIIAGFTEELLFRGILFRYIEKVAGSWIALALTSALFGAAHLFNPGATWFSSFAIAVEAGILLGAVYMLTRHLWAAMGLHAAWNFTQGWIFGLPVSGGHGGTGLMNGQLTGSDLLTGGAFGLEASLPAVIVATTAGVAILAVAVRRSGAVPPRWARKPVVADAAFSESSGSGLT